MTLTSTRYKIVYPNPDRSDVADVPAHIGNVVTAIENSVMYSGAGNLAGRPVSTPASPGVAGRLYLQNDVTPQQLWYDFGTGWDNIGAPANSSIGITQLDPAIPIVPVGSMLDWPWAAASLPAWALLPYGQLLTAGSYPALQALADASGRPYGGTAGTNFNLPDFRGRLGAGKDDMGGTAAGRITAAISGQNGTVLGAAVGTEGVTLSTGQMPAHNHTATATADTQGAHSHTGATGSVGNHSHTGQTAGNGDQTSDVEAQTHTHKANASYPAQLADVSGNTFSLQGGTQGAWQNFPYNRGIAAYTDVAANGHTHRVASHVHAISADGAHGHSISTDGSHTHNVTVTNASVGGGGVHPNMPPTIVVNKLMRAL
jgi:microcystin-dependent protein